MLFLGGVGEFAARFDDLLGEVVADAGFVAGDREVRGAEQLFLAIAQGVASTAIDSANAFDLRELRTINLLECGNIFA